MKTLKEYTELEEFKFENVQLVDIAIGSSAHDGRGFFSLQFEGAGWEQGVCPAWDRETVDKIIAICRKPDLQRCIGSYVRVGYHDARGLIAVIAPLVGDTPFVAVGPSLS